MCEGNPSVLIISASDLDMVIDMEEDRGDKEIQGKGRIMKKMGLKEELSF